MFYFGMVLKLTLYTNNYRIKSTSFNLLEITLHAMFPDNNRYFLLAWPLLSKLIKDIGKHNKVHTLIIIISIKCFKFNLFTLTIIKTILNKDDNIHKSDAQLFR